MDKTGKTIYVMVGLPRSGKSTVCKLLGFPIVSKDAIRLTVHGTPFKEDMESYVHGVCDLMVNSLFNAGHKGVIVDECHVTIASRSRWENLGYAVRIVYIPTGRKECIDRARASGQEYLVPIIKRMDHNFHRPSEHEVWYEVPLEKAMVPVLTRAMMMEWVNE